MSRLATRERRRGRARGGFAFAFAFAWPLALTFAWTSAFASSAAADPPGSASASADSVATSPCDDDEDAWAARASARTHLAVSAFDCPQGLVRLRVAGAGCDFEVAHAGGFQRTADGLFGVSPIANLEWDTAPAPMKSALAGVLAALEADPSLRMPDRARFLTSPSSSGMMAALRQPKGLLVGAGLLVALVAVALRLRLRSKARRRGAAGDTPPS